MEIQQNILETDEMRSLGVIVARGVVPVKDHVLKVSLDKPEAYSKTGSLSRVW